MATTHGLAAILRDARKGALLRMRPEITGRTSIPETPENNREAAAYWIVRSSRTTTIAWESNPLAVIARSDATKQSIFLYGVSLDCFAEPVIGRVRRPISLMMRTTDSGFLEN